MKHAVWLLAMLILLGACQSRQPAPDAIWTLNGRVLIRTAEDAGAYQVFWQQRVDGFDLRLSGTLGTTLARVQRSSGSTCIDVPRKETRCASTGAQLLREETGISFPVEALRYWVRGQPVPARRFRALAMGFSQSGWRVEYPNRAAGLPKRIDLSQPGISLKLVISAWR